MHLLRLTVRHACPFSAPVAEVPESRVTHLCHRGEEAVLELHAADAEGFGELVDRYERLGGTVVARDEDGRAALVRFTECACCRSGRVIPSMESIGLLYLPPSGYERGGEEVYQFLARSPVAERDLLRGVPDGVELAQAAVRPLGELRFEDGFLVPIGTLFHGLTPRQRHALVTAVQRGYYRIPRPVTTAELARSFSISREAFEALLRKGENKLVAALFPYLVLGQLDSAPVHPTEPGSVAPSPRPILRPNRRLPSGRRSRARSVTRASRGRPGRRTPHRSRTRPR